MCLCLFRSSFRSYNIPVYVYGVADAYYLRSPAASLQAGSRISRNDICWPACTTTSAGGEHAYRACAYPAHGTLDAHFLYITVLACVLGEYFCCEGKAVRRKNICFVNTSSLPQRALHREGRADSACRPMLKRSSMFLVSAASTWMPASSSFFFMLMPVCPDALTSMMSFSGSLLFVLAKLRARAAKERQCAQHVTEPVRRRYYSEQLFFALVTHKGVSVGQETPEVYRTGWRSAALPRARFKSSEETSEFLPTHTQAHVVHRRKRLVGALRPDVCTGVRDGQRQQRRIVEVGAVGAVHQQRQPHLVGMPGYRFNIAAQPEIVWVCYEDGRLRPLFSPQSGFYIRLRWSPQGSRTPSTEGIPGVCRTSLWRWLRLYGCHVGR